MGFSVRNDTASTTNICVATNTTTALYYCTAVQYAIWVMCRVSACHSSGSKSTLRLELGMLCAQVRLLLYYTAVLSVLLLYYYYSCRSVLLLILLYYDVANLILFTSAR